MEFHSPTKPHPHLPLTTQATKLVTQGTLQLTLAVLTNEPTLKPPPPPFGAPNTFQQHVGRQEGEDGEQSPAGSGSRGTWRECLAVREDHNVEPPSALPCSVPGRGKGPQIQAKATQGSWAWSLGRRNGRGGSMTEDDLGNRVKSGVIVRGDLAYWVQYVPNLPPPQKKTRTGL